MNEQRWRFQAALNRALSSYLHATDVGRWGRVLYPLAARPRTPLRDLALAGADLGIRLPSLADVAVALAGAYRAVDDLPALDTLFHEHELPAFDPATHGRVPGLARVRQALLACARETGVEFFLHGSFATLDFTRYSDLDTLALVPRSVATDAGALRACRDAFIARWRAVKEFDPLQHHGHFILTEIDLRGYPDPLYPRTVLERSVAFAPRPRILRLRAEPSAAIAEAKFRGLAERFLRTDLARGMRNAYRLKSDLSVFMLLPALWCQAQGCPTGKRESFGRVYRLLSPAAVAAFQHAAAIREAWRYQEPVWGRWLRRAWFNALLPAAVDAAGAGRPAVAVRDRLDPTFFAAAKGAVRELMELDETNGSQHGVRKKTHDRVA